MVSPVGTGQVYSMTMALSAGSSLGPYEVVSPLGAGGMGVVYRARDTRLMAEMAPLAQNHQRRMIEVARAGASDPRLEEFRWLLEELRVSLFAQELRTPYPVSVKRLQKLWRELTRGG